MTDISEVLASLKRSNLSIEETSQEIIQSLEIANKGLENLKKPVEDLMETEKKTNEEISKYESTNLSLSKEISNLKEEKTSYEQNLASTQEKFNDTTEKRTKLEGKLRETKTKLDDTKNQLDVAKKELSALNLENEKINAEIEQLVSASDQQLHELNTKTDQKRDIIRKSKGERMALEYLIKKNHIEFNEIKIINALEGRKKTDMATITKVTGLSENLITRTLEGLSKRKVLEFDSSSGEITILGSLKI